MVFMFEEKPSFHILTNTVKFFSTKYQNKVKNYYLQPKKNKNFIIFLNKKTRQLASMYNLSTKYNRHDDYGRHNSD